MRCGFLRIYAPTPYSAVFLLHTLAPAPIKISCSAVWCGSYGFISCVDEAYTPNKNNILVALCEQNISLKYFFSSS